jgi:thiamine pyrophosphokinase
MKCFQSVDALERESSTPYNILLLGGLAGRLDQTIHTMSFLHKQRGRGRTVYVLTDDNMAWLLDSGEHEIHIDEDLLGPTCGLLPVGIDSTILTTRGLQWDLKETESSFDGMVSSSNATVADRIWISTTKPIWWNIEVKRDGPLLKQVDS